MYIIAPNCQLDSGTPLITHQDLIYNAGMDKEKLLDVNGKSYIKTKCIETGK